MTTNIFIQSYHHDGDCRTKPHLVYAHIIILQCTRVYIKCIVFFGCTTAVVK